MKNRIRKAATVNRKANGASLVELPMMLWLMFGLMMLPMLALATITLKSALMNAAVQDGAHFASKAKTFENSVAGKPSAITLASDAVRNAALKFNGLTIDSVTTQIVVIPVGGGPVTRTGSKLTAPADTSKFLYQIETVAKGKIAPLLPLNPRVVGEIPGMSAPILVSYSAREMAENPQGLNR
jgi:hypothetical protein